MAPQRFIPLLLALRRGPIPGRSRLHQEAFFLKRRGAGLDAEFHYERNRSSVWSNGLDAALDDAIVESRIIAVLRQAHPREPLRIHFTAKSPIPPFPPTLGAISLNDALRYTERMAKLSQDTIALASAIAWFESHLGRAAATKEIAARKPITATATAIAKALALLDSLTTGLAPPLCG